jgi:hypothetical protein
VNISHLKLRSEKFDDDDDNNNNNNNNKYILSIRSSQVSYVVLNNIWCLKMAVWRCPSQA